MKLGSIRADERGHHVERIGMTDDNDDLSDVDRRSIRILARSTKAAGPANARIAERLEKAAGSGTRTDYRRAEESFDSLPARERRRIGTHAERQAETERQLSAARKQQPAVPRVAKPPAPAVDDTLDWKPMILDHSPATDAPDALSWKPIPPEANAKAKPAGSIPKPAMPKPAASTGRAPGKAAPATGRPAPAPGRQKGPAIALDPSADATADATAADDDKGWDWQRIPDDPVLKSTRKKPAAADPIEELRRQMLGDDLKRR